MLNDHRRLLVAWSSVAIASSATAACSSDRTDSKSNTPTERTGNTQVVDSGCSGRLQPEAAIGEAFTVGTGTADSCAESGLRDAITSIGELAAGGSITFDCGPEPVTITLSSELAVKGTLLLDGGGKVTLSGNRVTRILNLGNYANLTLQRITLRDGLTDESGAAILHPWYGTLRAIDVIFENNHCTSLKGEIGGGAVFAGGLSEAVFSGCRFVGNSASNGGGLLNRGSTLTIIDSVFEQNEATSESASGGQYGNGGGLYIDGMNYDTPGDFHLCGTIFRGNHAKQHGSAVFSFFYAGSNAFVDRCLIDQNDFAGSSGGGAGGYYHEAVPLQLTNTTFARNTSLKHAAALFVGSGSSALIANCTFDGNQVPEVGAAIFTGASPVTVQNSTFAENSADYAPVIFKGDSASVSLQNCIFWNNITPNQYSALACHESFTDGGGNIQWPKTKASGNADTPCTTGIVFADADLQPLTTDSTFPPVMRLGAGSPAIGIGTNCSATDALGNSRGATCDAGAVESAF